MSECDIILTFVGDLCICCGRTERTAFKSRSAEGKETCGLFWEEELLPMERFPIRPMNWCGRGFLVILRRISLNGSLESQPSCGEGRGGEGRAGGGGGGISMNVHRDNKWVCGPLLSLMSFAKMCLYKKRFQHLGGKWSNNCLNTLTVACNMASFFSAICIIRKPFQPPIHPQHHPPAHKLARSNSPYWAWILNFH